MLNSGNSSSEIKQDQFEDEPLQIPEEFKEAPVKAQTDPYKFASMEEEKIAVDPRTVTFDDLACNLSHEKLGSGFSVEDIIRITAGL